MKYQVLFSSKDKSKKNKSDISCNFARLFKGDKKENKTCHRDRIARLTVPCPSHKQL